MGKERSPNYPQVALNEAVELVKKFFSAEGRTSVDNETAAKALGYNTVSGASRTKIAALKQYDFLQGRGDKLSITSLGMRIVHPDNDADYAAALQDAALSPELFASLRETHAEASDTAIVAYLVKTKNFTPEGARLASKSFKDTLAFAKLEKTAHTDAGKREENLPPKDNKVQVQPPPSPGLAATMSAQDIFQRTFTTGNDDIDASITISSRSGTITSADIAFLKDYLDFLEKSWTRRKPRETSTDAASQTAHPQRPAAESAGVSVPIMITTQQERELREAGYSQEQINSMTPQEAHDALVSHNSKTSRIVG